MQRQLVKSLVYCKPLSLPSNSPGIFPFGQLLRHRHHVHFCSVLVLTILKKQIAVICTKEKGNVSTSKTPRHLPSFPMTPASSRTSLVAVTLGSSCGSTPPPGTIHFSGFREDVTSRTCVQKTYILYSSKINTVQTKCRMSQN